jgi:hypothetical protein
MLLLIIILTKFYTKLNSIYIDYNNGDDIESCGTESNKCQTFNFAFNNTNGSIFDFENGNYLESFVFING